MLAGFFKTDNHHLFIQYLVNILEFGILLGKCVEYLLKTFILFIWVPMIDFKTSVWFQSRILKSGLAGLKSSHSLYNISTKWLFTLGLNTFQLSVLSLNNSFKMDKLVNYFSGYRKVI